MVVERIRALAGVRREGVSRSLVMTLSVVVVVVVATVAAAIVGAAAADEDRPKAAAEVVKTEAQGQSWLQRTWRTQRRRR